MSALERSSPGAEGWLLRLALLAALVAAGFAIVVRVAGALQPAEVRLRDDAYYYFVWATHWANGAGPCVTLGVATSGVHWLWAWCLAAVSAFASIRDPLELAEWARWLGLAVHGLTAVVSCGLVPRGLRLAALGLYLGNPFLLHEAQNGQATALACLALAVLLTLCFRATTPLVVRTLLGTLAVLARSDLCFHVLALGWARDGAKWRALVPAGCALAVLLTTNLAFTGRLTQDSTWPLPWLFWQRFLATDPDTGAWLHHLWYQVRPCLLSWPFTTAGLWPGALIVWGGLRALVGPTRRWVPLALIAIGYGIGARDWLAALLGAGLVAAFPHRHDAPGSRVLPALLAAGVALAMTHYVLRLNAPPHYFAVFGVGAIAALGALFRIAGRVGCAIVIVTAAFQARDAVGVPESYPAQVEMAAAAEVLRECWPESADAAIGSFNCGILTASHSGRVVDLDGLVNASAFAALRAGALSAYLDREGIRLLVDWPAMFAPESRNPHASGRWFGSGFVAERDLVEIARIDAPGHDGGWPGTDAVRIYWRRAHGARPAPLPAPVVLRTRDGGLWVGWQGARGQTLVAGAIGDPAARTSLGEGAEGVATFFRLPGPTASGNGVFVRGQELPLLRY